MRAKMIRRGLLILPMTALISLLAFGLLYAAPGDTAMLILRERTNISTLTEEDAAAFAEEKGLNTGFFPLYTGWLASVLRGDLGTSYVDGQSVNAKLGAALGKTMKLSMIAWVVYTVLGTGVGILAAVRRRGILDRLTRYWSILSTAIPVFWIGLFAVWLFSVKLGVLATVGKRSDLSLLFPGVLMGVVYAGNLIVIAREKARLVLEEPFVLGARAMGVRKGAILRNHVLKNILPPVIATSALAFSDFVGASVLMENIFSISGFGKLLTDAIRTKDYLVVAGATLAIGVLCCVVNLLADIAYSLIDGRAEPHER